MVETRFIEGQILALGRHAEAVAAARAEIRLAIARCGGRWLEAGAVADALALELVAFTTARQEAGRAAGTLDSLAAALRAAEARS